MFTGLLHTHRAVVILFLLIYLIKTALLLFAKPAALAGFTRRIKVPEMVVSFLFLLTGGWMFAELPASERSVYLYAKIGVVLLAIPVAIVGFKRANKALGTLALLLVVGAYGLGEINKRASAIQPVAAGILTDPTVAGYSPVTHGQGLYAANCVACHGPDGTLGAAGAKSLKTSLKTPDEVVALLQKGKNSMPSYKKVLTLNDMTALAAYVQTLRGAQP
ncbi:MAG: c-type cytochrome [Bernardetiaceae bacterium]|jgi:mono/diheme cytochrome c family protein|nr:c-type cytochrome [Bernardetiaceae bacterium]